MGREVILATVSDPLRVGTRGSALALRQTEWTVETLRRRRPGIEIKVVQMTTQGDRDRRRGTTPDFTGALEEALRAGRIDLAVHSAKDLPATDPSGLIVAAYPRRADPRDCWVAARPSDPLSSGARVGTSSLRRRAQLKRWRPDLRLEEIRGNVDSRIRRVREGALDAVVVAKAGIDRLGRADELTGILPSRRFLPSPGQGSLALQVRRSDRRTWRIARAIDHAPTRAAVTAERAVARALGASCDLPLGVLGRVRTGRLYLSAEVLSADGTRTVRAELQGPAGRATELGRALARRLERGGARSLLG